MEKRVALKYPYRSPQNKHCSDCEWRNEWIPVLKCWMTIWTHSPTLFTSALVVVNSSSRFEHFLLLTAYGLKLDMWHLLTILTLEAYQPLAKQDICPIPIKPTSPWPPKTCHPLRLSFWVLLSYILFIPMATRMYSYYGVYHVTKLFVCLILSLFFFSGLFWSQRQCAFFISVSQHVPGMQMLNNYVICWGYRKETQ